MGIKELKGEEAVKEAKKFIEKNSKCSECGRSFNVFSISRIPPKTREEFVKYCNEELCGDYGMGLKWLWDFYKGTLGHGSELADMKAEEALSQIAEMKSSEPEEKKETIRLCNGKEIKKR